MKLIHIYLYEFLEQLTQKWHFTKGFLMKVTLAIQMPSLLHSGLFRASPVNPESKTGLRD